MTNSKPPLLPPFSSDTAVDYLLIAVSIVVGLSVIVARLVG